MKTEDLLDRRRPTLAETLHRSADLAVAKLMGLKKLFAQGWGPPRHLGSLIREIAQSPTPTPIELNWTGASTRSDGTVIRDGYFLSPAQHLPLPASSRTAYIQAVLPADHHQSYPVCIHLAGSGDSTFIGRRHLALTLAREYNIGSIILENPFYGTRRPSGQIGTKLRTVRDQFALNIAAIQETLSLLQWLNKQGTESIGVSGYSMGGYMAGVAAQMTSLPVAVVPCATGQSAVYPLIYSPLRQMIHWKKLNRQLAEPYRAETTLARLLSTAAIPQFGQLTDESEAIIVASRYDQFVLDEDVYKLQRHWDNCQLRWLNAGHTTGWFLRGQRICETIASCFSNLRD